MKKRKETIVFPYTKFLMKKVGELPTIKMAESRQVDLLVMQKIDTLISKLQVYNYRITINNHNIGDYHNIMIQRYFYVKMPVKEIYQLKLIEQLQLRLPSEFGILEDKLKDLLYDAEQNFSA